MACHQAGASLVLTRIRDVTSPDGALLGSWIIVSQSSKNPGGTIGTPRAAGPKGC